MGSFWSAAAGIVDPLNLTGVQGLAQDEDIKKAAKDLKKLAATAPKYEIPEELMTAISQMEETYGGLTDEAKTRYEDAQAEIEQAKMENMPGYQSLVDQIGSSRAASVSQAQRYGGYGALGELSDIQRGEMEALRSAAAQNAQFRIQQEQLARQREMQAFGQYQGIAAQGASAGLQGAQIMADQKATQFYQNELMPWQMQFNVEQSMHEAMLSNDGGGLF